jgi:nuclease-like protein
MSFATKSAITAGVEFHEASERNFRKWPVARSSCMIRLWEGINRAKNMTLLVVLAIIVWVAALLLKWKLPTLLGRSGENFVSRKLAELDPTHYKVLNDLMLPSLGNTDTTQIDHVVVSAYSIFVIETKAHSGWIFGNAYHRNWTQVIYRYKKTFYNPLRQNYAHIKAVEALIKPLFPAVPIVGYVIFPSAERLQISGADNVGHAIDVLPKIAAYRTPMLTDDEMQKVIELLTAANISDKGRRKQHTRDTYALKTKKKIDNKLIDSS